VSRDVKLEGNLASSRSQETSTVTENKEKPTPKDGKHSIAPSSRSQTSGGEELSPSSYVRRCRWLLQTLRDVGDTPSSAVRERRSPWKDAMVEECTSIMRNDVWDIVSRPEGKPVVSSR
jgi:hypothetical protein